ncbi:DUF5412 family protein [Paenibacillus algorifonticola]|uniref:DUF5412 family protein n=1 Tax=Paenibacillus algorifonticola TaxID=684063 RepID=UPI003D2D3217
MSEEKYEMLLYLMIAGAVATAICLMVFILSFVGNLIKKSKRPPKVSLMLTIIGAFAVGIYCYNHFNNLDFLPKGELNPSAVVSPEGQYKIRTYHYTGLFYRTARAEVVNIESGKSKTIYFNDYDRSPAVQWIGNGVVKIGRETLDISKNEVFDFRDTSHENKTLPPQGRI